MVRILVFAVATILGWTVSPAAVASAVPTTTSTGGCTYDAPAHDCVVAYSAPERGPPTHAEKPLISAGHYAVVHRSHGNSARSQASAAAVTYGYDRTLQLTQVAHGRNPDPPPLRVATAVLSSLRRSQVAAKNACTVNSFDDDTPVLMADGTLKAIAEVELGDMVWATHPETGEEGSRPIVDLIRHAGLHTMVQVELADGSTIDATDGHPFWVGGRAPPSGAGSTGVWVDAIDLRLGDELVTADGGRREVSSLNLTVEDLTAYNLAVAELHTYYAGDEPVLVHNCGKGSWVSPKEFADSIVKSVSNIGRGSATATGQHGAGYLARARALKDHAKNGGYLPEIQQQLLAKAKQYEMRARSINHPGGR